MPADNELLKELIRVLDKMNPEHINGCVILHFDKETKELKSISPMLNVTSIKELYGQLNQAKHAIHHFLNDLTNKGLHKN